MFSKVDTQPFIILPHPKTFILQLRLQKEEWKIVITITNIVIIKSCDYYY